MRSANWIVSFARTLLLPLCVALFVAGGMSSTMAGVKTPTKAEQAKALAPVPKDVRQYYSGYWYMSDLIADPFANWKPHSPPWQICHNDSYLGNNWRANLVAELKAVAKQLAAQGLAKPNVIVTNSNGDINLELTQLKAEIAQGCDVITAYAGSPTGLCSGIKQAYDHGVLFVAIDSAVTCPGALNVVTNPYYRGNYNGKFITKKLNGKGNLVVMNGQPGVTNTIALAAGLHDAIAPYPGIKVVGNLYGMWTGSVAKSKMLQYLATHPQPVQAVFSTGQMGVASGQAFEQSGRKVPMITEVTNKCSLLAYWKAKHLDTTTFVQDGGPMAYTALIPALHMLYGQKPKVNTIFIPLPTITDKNFNDYYKPSMTVQSNCFANGKDLHLVPNSYFDQFFTGGNGKPIPTVNIVATD